MKVRTFIPCALISFLVAAASVCFAQPPKVVPEGKAEEIIERGVKAMGGDRYLQVKTIIGRGFFTEYHEGNSQVPIKFIDYLVYPDKERTEFSGGGQRRIQTNFRDGGWVYDGAALTLKDQTSHELEDFRLAVRTSVENLLYGWWKTQGARLSYAGRRESGVVGRRNEAVRLTYEDGFWIEYEFSADDGTPAKVLYLRKEKNRDTEEMDDVKEEDRLYKQITIEGVTVSMVIDHYRNGTQTSRIAYESVEHNKPLADSLFAKPASFKAVK